MSNSESSNRSRSRTHSVWRSLILGSGLYAVMLAGFALVPLRYEQQIIDVVRQRIAPRLAQSFPNVPAFRNLRSSRPSTSNPSMSEPVSPSELAAADDTANEDTIAARYRPDPNTSLCQSAQYAAALVQLTSPDLEVGQAIEAVQHSGRQALAFADFVEWPEIHERARMTRVPVLMYHDILPEMEVFFDVTPDQLEAHFQMIRDNGLTPISLDELMAHLRTGRELPSKPVVLTFDDGYVGHYEHVYPLMQKYGYPATFSIFTAKVNGDIVGRSTVTWDHLKTMVADPLVTIAAHSVTHPADLTLLPDEEMVREIEESKRVLEEQLGIPIRYFTYPEGNHDERVMNATAAAGFEAALAMSNYEELFAGASKNVLAIERFGQSSIEQVVEQAWGGPPPPRTDETFRFDFDSPVSLQEFTIDELPLQLISGGTPVTIHADSRYQVPEIIADTEVVAAVDGGFFSMEHLDSNVMIGPVMSQSTGEFVPGVGEINKLADRPLVVLQPGMVDFVPFDPEKHNTLDGLQADFPEVTDAFVGAAWLVKDGEPRSAYTFNGLFDYDAERHRAFWGINHAGEPVVGVSAAPVDSVRLGKLLSQVGLRDVVMLDSGASTSLAYQGESLVYYEPRPVPHVVGLVPPATGGESCVLVAETMAELFEPEDEYGNYQGW